MMDIVAKIFFGAPERQPYLVHFANTVIRPPRPWTKLEVINPAITPKMVGEKGAILDILARSPQKEFVHIEVQNESFAAFLQRTLPIRGWRRS
jgi:predicted transposase/invertase (TIGR01784 family)